MTAQPRSRLRSCRPVRASVHGLVVAALACGGVSLALPAQAAPTPAGPADASSAADAATAALIASRYHHPVTDLSSLTETTTAEIQPDGTTRLTISTEPVRVRRGAAWRDVSTALAKASDGMLAPAASPAPVEFSAGGPGPLARVQTPNGGWMSVASPLGPLPDGVVDGSSITYPEVLPGVDLRLSATTAGMSEILVVKTPEAAANPRLSAVRFAIAGAQVKPGAAQDSATATAADGSVVVSPTPTWWDSTDGGTADRPGGAGLTRPVTGGTEASAVVVDAGDAARTPGVKYPVFVDPDFTGGTQAWTFVDSRYPTASYWLGSNHGSDNEAHVGYISATYSADGAHTDRTFWQLNTSGLYGKHILAAHFDTQEIYSSACTNNAFSLYITGSINSGTTWNTQPGFIQRVSGAVLGPQGRSCSIPLQSGVGFDAVGVANWAATNGNTNMTVALKADNEGDFTTWRRFLHGATMTVSYNTAPNTPSAPWDAGSPCSTTAPGKVLHHTAASRISLGVSASDPDGGNVQTVFYVARVSNGANALDPAVYPKGYIDGGSRPAGANNVVIQSDLADGAYEWHARSADGIDWSPGYSPMCYFQVKNTPPGAPVVTPSATTGLTVGTPMTMSLAPAGANDGVVGYAWTWQPSANAPTYGQMPACGSDTAIGGIHYACGSSVTLTVSPESGPAPSFTVWAFDSGGNRSVATVVTLSAGLANSSALAAVSHQWTTDLGGALPASACPSGAGTVACVADNNLGPAADQPNGQYPMPIPAGVALGGPTTGTLSFVAGALAMNQGGQTVSLTVPAGVTTADFGVVTVATKELGDPPGATLPGWTVRDDQGNPSGEYSSSSYIFTRLGGQQAGDVLTVTLPVSVGAKMAAAWYDTGGRDVQAVGPLWDTDAKVNAQVSWPAPSYTGTADVLLVAASRTQGGPTISTPQGAAIDYQLIDDTGWYAGGIFGHAQGVSPTDFSATWDAGVKSHNVNALQLVLAAPAPVVTSGPAGVLTFNGASSGVMSSSPGVVVDTKKSFTVGAWINPVSTDHVMTAVSERGSTNSGFFLQLTAQGQWRFDVHSTTSDVEGVAVAPGGVTAGQPVYVAGVYDAVNREVRVYVNGSLSAVANYVPDAAPSADGGVTIGSAWYHGALADSFDGQIANPAVVQGALAPVQISDLQNEAFFFSDLG